MNDSNVAIANFAETTYERKYMEVRASIGDSLPVPPSMRANGANPSPYRITMGSGVETPQWLGPLGLALLTLGAVGLFARLKGEERILIGLRFKILDHLRREPGQHQSAIQRAFCLSSGSAVYNLRVLEDKGYITAHRDGRHKRFYVNGNSLRPVANGMTMDPSTVHWHAERLEKVGMLKTLREGRKVAYHLDRPDIIHQILAFIP